MGPGGSRISLPLSPQPRVPGKLKIERNVQIRPSCPGRRSLGAGTLSTPHPVHSLEGGSHVFRSQENLLGSQNMRPREGDGHRAPVPSVVRAGPPRRAQLSIWEIHGPVSSIQSNTLPPTPDTLTRGPLLPPCPGAPHLSGLSGSFHIFCTGHPPATQTSLQQPHPH